MIEAGILDDDVLCARAGIPEDWISAGAYRPRSVLAAGESLTTQSVPGLAVDVAGLFR